MKWRSKCHNCRTFYIPCGVNGEVFVFHVLFKLYSVNGNIYGNIGARTLMFGYGLMVVHDM